MEIYFATKEENNKRREEEFLKLNPGERLLLYLKMISVYPLNPESKDGVHPNHLKGNFVIEKKDVK